MPRRHTHPIASIIIVLAAAVLASSCGGDRPADQGATQPPAEANAGLQRSAAPPGAVVFIVTPQDGATTSSPVNVKFGVSGMTVAPSGTYVPDTGHHHLLIDTELADPDAPVPADAQHVHYGKGQTEAEIELEPGQHTLQLVLADGNHIPHQPPVVSKVVTITVE